MMSSNIRALYDQIIVKPERLRDRETKGGIVIPASVSQEVEGKVVALGEGLPRSDGSFMRSKLEIGDKVLFMSSSALLFTFEGEQLAKISPQNVIVVIG